MPKSVSFADEKDNKEEEEEEGPVLDHFQEEQHRKDQRGLFKLKREIWIQDRKDRRAYMEIISQSESDINVIHNIMGSRKTHSLFFDYHSKELDKRIKRTNTRIYTSELKIANLTKKINKAEVELLNSTFIDNE